MGSSSPGAMEMCQRQKLENYKVKKKTLKNQREGDQWFGHGVKKQHIRNEIWTKDILSRMCRWQIPDGAATREELIRDLLVQGRYECGKTDCMHARYDICGGGEVVRGGKSHPIRDSHTFCFLERHLPSNKTFQQTFQKMYLQVREMWLCTRLLLVHRDGKGEQ